ncbi:MAG: hypothetical protein Q8O19_04335 [Rectinemataceae bacterium]|nr:hypothetical protein [Rectinemataceae bacterium]
MGPEDEHFIAVKLYNRDKVMIVEVNHPAVRLIEGGIDRHRRAMVMTDAVHFRKFYAAGGQINVMVITPLKAGGNGIAGYFEGVYKVNPRRWSSSFTMDGSKRFLSPKRRCWSP